MRSLLITSFFIFFISCSAYHALERIEGLTCKISERVSSFAERENRLHKDITVSAVAMEKDQSETPGNFTTDLSLYLINTTSSDNKADFCFLNNGGLRSALPMGDIFIKRVNKLIGFENESFTLKGPATQLLIGFIVKKGGLPVSGIMMGNKSDNPINVLIDEKSFDVTKDYKIVTSENLVNGGDNIAFLAKAKDINYAGIKVWDASIKYMIEQHSMYKNLEARLDNRIGNV